MVTSDNKGLIIIIVESSSIHVNSMIVPKHFRKGVFIVITNPLMSVNLLLHHLYALLVIPTGVLPQLWTCSRIYEIPKIV